MFAPNRPNYHPFTDCDEKKLLPDGPGPEIAVPETDFGFLYTVYRRGWTVVSPEI